MFSPIVEYLLAQSRPGVGFLCYNSRWQWIIPLIPPRVTVSFSLAPPFGAYAAIKYALTITADTMPGAIHVQATQSGNKFLDGYIEDDWTREYTTYFVVFTHSDPIYAQVRNDSSLSQREIATQWNIIIPSEADYKRVIELIKEYSMVTSTELSRQANDLLRQLVEASGRMPTV